MFFTVLFWSLITVVIFFILLLLWFYLISVRQPPAYAMIVEKYYVCYEYRILHGGIFGKGPTRKFAGEKTWCWRKHWQEIDKHTFKQLAVQWYGVNWETRGDWWQIDKEQ